MMRWEGKKNRAQPVPIGVFQILPHGQRFEKIGVDEYNQSDKMQ